MNTPKKTLAKKTLFIVPCLLLAASVALGAPSASAEPADKTFAIKFVYDRTDTPAQIYADLRATACRECRDQIGASIHATWRMRGCIRDVVKAGVAALSRRDVADIYHRRA